MSKLFWRAIKALPVIVAGSLVAANASFAQSLNETKVDSTLQQINRYQDSGSNRSMSQVTNVNQLRDVSPSDWAYEALRSLVDRYGCIVGYPNQTYRGNRALSRYEFAAGLNSCLNQIERLIASSEAILREDIDTLNRLIQEFEAELATLGGRVDNLESRTAFLEDHQFSTTTKLKGEVIFALADTFGDVNDEDPTETTFSDRVRLNFDSSFYGKDRLRTRLQAGNVANFSDFTGADSTRLGYDFDNGNDIELTDLHYRFPIGDSFRGYVGTTGLDIDDVFEVSNPILESSGTGALSRFSRRDPITLRGAEGAGVGANYKIGDKVTVSALYLAETSDASDPDSDGDENGLFDGSFSTGAQVVVEPFESFEVALTYVYEYQEGDDVNLTGSTSSDLAKNPFEPTFGEIDTRAHQVGLGVTWEFAERFVLGASGSGSFARAVDEDNDAILYTTSLNFSVLDLGKEGAVLSLAGGIPPRLVKNEGGLEDEDTTFLIEALYKFPINDNILITPGAFVVINPDGNSDNDTQFIGVIRTTFKF
ncbi:MAG: iron uptake porin [Xenococcaceae cyanobacterium MO_188.B19]|nr:iron uptake porin [Xenococcaceae cyanobacterium MO_188.B19]